MATAFFVDRKPDGSAAEMQRQLLGGSNTRTV
jgi:hypothetical protein